MATCPASCFPQHTAKSSPPLEVPMVKVTAAEPARLRLACTGRIRFPTRSPSPPTSKPLPPLPLEPLSPAGLPSRSPCQCTHVLPSAPMSPLSPSPPSLQITTTHVPRMESTSPVQLTEANLHALNSRASTARDMLSAIRRRTVVSCGRMCTPPVSVGQASVREEWEGTWSAEDEKHRRRHSAPADLPKAGRAGFMHPVLALPGGF